MMMPQQTLGKSVHIICFLSAINLKPLNILTQDVVLYWSVSSFYGLAQNLVLMSPRARRLLRIPWTPAEKVTPYRDIINRIKDKKLFKTDSLR